MIYLDNSATTKLAPEVLDAMMPYLKEEYGNPSSKYYSLAENAKKAVAEARANVASLLGCDSDEIIFTSGATESNNMIIKGVSEQYGNHQRSIITTKAEHPSVLETCRYLESKGCHVVYLDVDQYARVTAEQVEQAILETDPVLVTIIWGNNEVGSLNPIDEISEICRKHQVYFHTDATQVVGKIPFQLNTLPGLRFMSLSAHKFNGPKGIGAAIIRKESENLYTKITPLIHGGGQENDYRSGTLAVHNIVGFGKAAELARVRLDAHRKQLSELEQYLVSILTKQFKEKIKFNHDLDNPDKKIPGILSVQFINVNNELLLKKLAPFAALSSGSACSSSKPSHVLQAIGKSNEEIRQTIRFSLSATNKKEDLDFFLNLK